MRALNMDDLVLLGEGEAVQKQFDLQNYVVLKRLFGLFAAAALGLAIAAIVQRDLWAGLAAAGNLLLVFAFFALRDSEFFERNFRRVNVLAILLELVFLILPFSREGGSVAFAGFIFPVVLLLFRFRTSEYFLLFGTFWRVHYFIGYLRELGSRDGSVS